MKTHQHSDVRGGRCSGVFTLCMLGYSSVLIFLRSRSDHAPHVCSYGSSPGSLAEVNNLMEELAASAPLRRHLIRPTGYFILAHQYQDGGPSSFGMCAVHRGRHGWMTECQRERKRSHEGVSEQRTRRRESASNLLPEWSS